ncbi:MULTISPECIES: hypothetical protein [unclassified Nocardioides]|uniref:hypothetical protein n=1 Tax=unclassified Nocardioides TaxID=2615069 RepID=UPI003620FD14
MSLWTPQDSDDLDRQVRALRQADKRDRSGSPPPPPREPRQPRPRQPYRRNKWPKPRQKPNGRWFAEVIEQGQYYSKTFDTQDEAQAYLDAITGRQDN